MVQVNHLSQLFCRISQQLHAKRDELCALDGHVGDGDHGISMDIGWAAVCDVSVDGVTDLGEYLKVCAKAFIQAVGASIGPLYGTAFLRAATVASGKQQLSVDDCVEMFRQGVQGMQERGKAQVGDKTLIDTFIPCVEAMDDAIKKLYPFDQVLQSAKQAAQSGMESTKDMVASIGRSSRLGERARGHSDPGAVSAYVIVETIYDFVLENFHDADKQFSTWS